MARRWQHLCIASTGCRLLRLVAPVVLVVLIVACRTPQPVTDTKMLGSQIYAVNCSTCHGPSGQGVGAVPRIVGSTSILSGDYDRTVITEGRLLMPAFGKVLTASQINEVVAFVATLRD